MRARDRVARLATLLVYLTALLAGTAQLATQPPASALAADPAPPQFLRDLPDLAGLISANDGWTVGGGYLYWANCPPVDSGGGYLRRWPLRGGRAVTIVNGKFCTNTNTWAADESGLYYGDGVSILRRPASNPFTIEPIAASTMPTSRIVLNNGTTIWRDYIFWLANNTLYSAHKLFLRQLAAPEPLGANAHSVLFANDNYFYWFADGVLYRALKPCLGFGGGACSKEVVAGENGDHVTEATLTETLSNSSTYPLWTSGTTIRGNWCRFNNTGRVCSPSTSYSSSQNNTVGGLATDGQFLFWIENRADVCGGIFGCSFGDSGQLMKWSLRQSVFRPGPFDTPQQIACKQCFANYAIRGIPGGVAVADGWIYFDTTNGISRIRADAPPISWDLAFKGWEITQGIQSLTNDVPLVANKPTYVRAYGNTLSGPGANNVEAILLGRDSSGVSLGLLRSLNGVQTFATNNGVPKRDTTNGGWLFQLPEAWTNAGTIRLTLQIDPRGVWSDPNRGNNGIANQSFSFARKAPVCIVAIPVRSHGPVANYNSPNFYFASDLLKRLWPISDVWLYHQDNDIAELQARFGIPPWEYGPYEIPDDTWKMIISLTARDLLSDDPDECDDARARTHYLGIVSPQTQTGNDDPDLGTNGSGRVGYDQAWIKLPKDDFAVGDWQAVRATTLAHELAHNYDREHVDCGDPAPDDPDGGYPYIDANGRRCTIDNRDQSQPSTHFGFNPADLSPIKPTDARDLMAYGLNRWISDYTFRGIMGDIPNAALADEGRAATQAARVPQLAAAAGAVLVTGVVTTTVGQGELSYGWVYPTAALGQGLIRKWQAHAAPTAQLGAPLAAPRYHLRLLDPSGAVLDDREVTLAESDLHGDQLAHVGQHDVQTFALTFPAPAGPVARMELMQDSTLLASLQPGGGAPTVSVLSPAGGETIDGALTLSWRASDPDPNDKLLFSVQYSPDNGQHWRALLSDFPNRSGSDTVTLNLDQLSGIPASSSGGLIRVAASDGYNTTLATSQPFTVANRAPEPHIDAPGSAALPAGQTVVLQGGATDVEDGGLSGDALRWALDGVELGNGQTQVIEGLAPGSHTLTLTASDGAGKAATATQTLTVAPLVIPPAVPSFDGECNDAAYASAARLPLAPYPDGTQAFVSLVRSADALYACFSGMRRTAAGSPGTLAIVRVDSDYGRRSAPGANDHLFSTNEAGVVTTMNGDGTGYVAWSGGASAQISASATAWSAELRIDAGSIGGMNHVVGLNVDQAAVNSASEHFQWPQRAGIANPSSWGAASLGDLPQLSALAPTSAPVGSGDTVVTLTGSGFVAGTLAALNGTALATTVISDTQLQATIPAANLALAGTFSVTLFNPGLEAAPSVGLAFSATNPLPRLTQATLNGSTLTVTGSNFAAGATVQFNGSDYAATGSGTQARVTVRSPDLVDSAGAAVTLFNPGPGGGVSNVVTLGAGGNSVYLPLLARR